MNEFTAKKLGEVLAFTRVGVDMSERGQKALTLALGPKALKGFKALLADQQAKIEKEANQIALNKAAATTAKLTNIMEAYVGDEWDNPAELLEWSGFYFGSAIIHWSLLLGATEVLKLEKLHVLSINAVKANQGFLGSAQRAIIKIAKQKANQ